LILFPFSSNFGALKSPSAELAAKRIEDKTFIWPKRKFMQKRKKCLNLQKRETRTESALGKALINASAHGAEGMREQRTRHMSCHDKKN
jgi:hypothetical protein